MKYKMCIYVFLKLNDIYCHLWSICMSLNCIIVFIWHIKKRIVLICQIQKNYVFICRLILNEIYMQAYFPDVSARRPGLAAVNNARIYFVVKERSVWTQHEAWSSLTAILMLPCFHHDLYCTLSFSFNLFWFRFIIVREDFFPAELKWVDFLRPFFWLAPHDPVVRCACLVQPTCLFWFW